MKPLADFGKVRTHVNPHGGLKQDRLSGIDRGGGVRTHVNPHGGLKRFKKRLPAGGAQQFGPTLILTED